MIGWATPILGNLHIACFQLFIDFSWKNPRCFPRHKGAEPWSSPRACWHFCESRPPERGGSCWGGADAKEAARNSGRDPPSVLEGRVQWEKKIQTQDYDVTNGIFHWNWTVKHIVYWKFTCQKCAHTSLGWRSIRLGCVFFQCILSGTSHIYTVTAKKRRKLALRKGFDAKIVKRRQLTRKNVVICCTFCGIL